ncbi:MAG: hypothetical protein E7603_04115 [Ruminococcaceae bacterium]|nr:hypothetical protein [Oscillospiraceae bacterium]
MKLIVPDYYNDFTCIADRCKHSCCIGWEIDIDDETLEKYQNINGNFGKLLQSGIEIGECGAHFRLEENERCPFLNQNGLCDIILTIGEEYLSQICTDHPRFCSFYSDRTEIGLGLCCEEVARILFSKQSKTRLIVFEDDGGMEIPTEKEISFFEAREKLLLLAQNREKTVSERMEDLQRAVGVPFPIKTFSEWTDVFLSLEIMDEEWRNLLLEVKSRSVPVLIVDHMETAWEQLLIYFIYRHISDPEREIAGSVLFAILGVYILQNLFAYLCSRNNNCNGEQWIELCRLYSSEIEYSEENMEKLLLLMEKSYR